MKVINQFHEVMEEINNPCIEKSKIKARQRLILFLTRSLKMSKKKLLENIS